MTENLRFIGVILHSQFAKNVFLAVDFRKNNYRKDTMHLEVVFEDIHQSKLEFGKQFALPVEKMIDTYTELITATA